MRNRYGVIFACLLVLAPCLAQAQVPPASDSFAPFLHSFNELLHKNEREKIADLCSFPKFNWEEGLGVEVSREVFLKNFEKIFTPEVRKRLKKGKYTVTSEGHRYTEWVRRKNRYSLWFNREKDGSYRFSGLYVGPAY